MTQLAKQLDAVVEPPDGMSPVQARTRNRLLVAAAEHFARYGYRRANISDIADEAGVGKGTVYLYFAGKIELLNACIAREKLELIPQLQQVMARPPAEQLEGYLGMTIRFVLTAPLSSAILKGDRDLAAALADAEAEGLGHTSEGIAFVGALVADAAPGINDEERDRLATVLVAVVGLPAHLSTVQGLMQLSTEDFITTYARILARGVACHRPGMETT